MNLPKLNYDDFYKFTMSIGIILLLVGAFASSYHILYMENWETMVWISFVFYFVLTVFGIIFIYWSARRWYKNQQIYDRKLEAETKISENSAEQLILADPTQKTKQKSPQIEYKICSIYLGTVKFNLLKDWKVWFIVQNYDYIKYKVYFIIHFYINDKKVDTIKEGYYGGIKAWNLNPHTLIRAPGLIISEKVKKYYNKNQGKFEIRIDCKIKDEKDNLLFKRLSIGYVYNPKNNSWFFEP